MTREEKHFLSSPYDQISDHQLISASWTLESAVVLMWALKLAADVPPFDTASDPELMELIETEWGTQRIINMFLAWRKELIRILKKLGMKSLRELVGRTDCLVHLHYMQRKG